MNTCVPALVQGNLAMVVTKVDKKMHFNICKGFLCKILHRNMSSGCWRHMCRWWGLPAFRILGHTSPSSEQIQIFRHPSGDRNTKMLSLPYNICLPYGIWYTVSSSCLPLMRLTPEEQSNEARNIQWCTWFSFVIPQDRGEGSRKWRVGGNLVSWGHGECKRAYGCWGMLIPETNFSINSPNTVVEMMLPQPPLFFHCQNSVFPTCPRIQNIH